MRTRPTLATLVAAGALLAPVAAPVAAADAIAAPATSSSPARAVIANDASVEKHPRARRTGAAIGLARDFGISLAAAQELLDSSYR